MKKISEKTKQRFEFAKSKGLNIFLIADLYGVRFANKLLKVLLRNSKNQAKTTYPLFPKFKVLKENQGKAIEQYIELLENCGVKIESWYEDFVDEDTGKIVSIPRIKFYTI